MTMSISVKSKTVGGNTSTKTIADVSETATDTQIKSFVDSLYALTTNTVEEVSKIEKTVVNTNKGNATIAFSKQPDGSVVDTWGLIDDEQGLYEYIITNSDGKPYIVENTSYSSAEIICEKGEGYDLYVLSTSAKDPAGIWDDDTITFTDSNGNPLSKIGYVNDSSITSETARIVIAIPATDNFNAAVATFYVKY